MATTFTNATIGYFELLLGVNFTKKNENQYRAKEHSSYLLFKGNDDALHFISFNGDFGDTPLNAFQLTKKIYPNLTNREIYERLGSTSTLDSAPIIKESEKKDKDTKTPKPKFITFQEDDNAASVFRTFNYFKHKIGIQSLKALKDYHIKTIKQYGKVSDKRNHKPLFAYCEGNNIKIKDPQKAVFDSKIVLRTPIKDYVFGLEALLKIPDAEAKTILIAITEGEDDVLAVNYHCKNIKAITFGGVTNALNPAIIEQLKAKFAGVFVAFDNDAAGIKNAPIQAQKHNLPYFICPTKQSNSKDFCDLLKDTKFNSTEFESLLLNAINKVLLAETEVLSPILAQTNTNFSYYICKRTDALQTIKNDNHALVVCEKEFQQFAKKYIDNNNIPIIDYKALSTINQRDVPYNIYCFGSQLLQRPSFENVAQRLLDLAPQHKIILLADTNADLFFASEKHDLLQHTTKHTIVKVHKQQQKGIFLTLAQLLPNVKCLECGKSLMQSIDEKRIILKADLGFCDKDNTLLIYVNENLHILPNEYQGFKEVIFVCNQDATPQNMSVNDYINNELLITQSIIRRLENNTKYELEKNVMTYFSNALIKPIFDKQTKKWIVPPAAAHKVAYEYQRQNYAFDYTALARATNAKVFDLDDFIAQIPTQEQATTIDFKEQVDFNEQTIKLNIEILKADKRTDFDSFAKEIEPYITIDDVIAYATQKVIVFVNEEGVEQTMIEKRVLKPGEKLFLKRLKELCKYVPYQTAFEMVRDNYYHFEKVKNIARVQKVLERPDGESKYADRMKRFAKKGSTGWHTKEALAAAFDLADVGDKEKDKWKQVRNSFFILSKTKRINGVVTRVYQLELLI
jgi:hypothetical protein